MARFVLALAIALVGVFTLIEGSDAPARGPSSIRTENGQLATYIYVDIRDRDLGSYVADAQRAVQASIAFPPGYYIMWSGQYEYLERAAFLAKPIRTAVDGYFSNAARFSCIARHNVPGHEDHASANLPERQRSGSRARRCAAEAASAAVGSANRR